MVSGNQTPNRKPSAARRIKNALRSIKYFSAYRLLLHADCVINFLGAFPHADARGNRVISPIIPGMTADNPPCGKPAALQNSMLANRLLRILRTGGIITATGIRPQKSPLHRREHPPININRQKRCNPQDPQDSAPETHKPVFFKKNVNSFSTSASFLPCIALRAIKITVNASGNRC